MKMIPSRTLATRPQEVWEDLEREGAVVITEHGVPRSIMVPTSAATLIEDIQELVFTRARRAVRQIRARARTAGSDMTRPDIEREIKEGRRSRTRQGGM